MQLDVDFISKVLKNVQVQSGPFPQDSQFSVDTRTIQRGEVYVALHGQRVDGHDFIQEAIDKGASGFILSSKHRTNLLEEFGSDLSKKYLLFVDDTLQALVDLAKNWRSQFTYPVIGITGSVGKTTTKEMVRNILKLTNIDHLVSFGNQNSLIGISLNILKMRAHHKVAVFEVGISSCGSMKQLAELLQPTYALIVKIGHGHMQGLGDLASIAHEKREIFSTLSDRNIGIINGDQPELADIAYTHPVVRFGLKTRNQIQARKVVVEDNRISFVAKIYDEKFSVILPTCNQGRVLNALAAIAIGFILKIPNQTIVKGVEQPVLVKGRFQVSHHPSGSVLINDAYNSNPESAKVSLLSLNSYEPEKQKVVVLGDMMDLGDDSSFWHRQIGRLFSKLSNIAHVVLIGSKIKETYKSLPINIKATVFQSTDQAFDFLKTMILEKNKVFLFKGSNSTGLLKLVEKLEKNIK